MNAFLLSMQYIAKFQYLILKEHDTPNFQGMVILDVENPLFFLPFLYVVLWILAIFR